jgi:alpha-tubulin suppressor-like RCC1 family protein
MSTRSLQIPACRTTALSQYRWLIGGLALLVMLGGVILVPQGAVLAATTSAVQAWGLNASGQLGNGANTTTANAVAVRGLSGVSAVATAGDHNLALRDDGTVWAWGYNVYGQLGDGTTTKRNAPVQVSGLNSVIAVAAGDEHSLALKGDGTVWAWGANGSEGRLGDGTSINRPSPVQVTGLTDVKAIGAGFRHSLAIKNDGTVRAWGWNGYGQLGDGTLDNSRRTPVQTVGLGGVAAVAGGYGHTIALLDDGSVWSWGRNINGQLGNGTTTDRATPAPIGGLVGVVDIAAGDYHNLAVLVDGTVRAWGLNSSGQLGDGTLTQRATPGAVSGLAEVADLAAGLAQSLAAKTDGTAWAWGDNRFGKLGDGTTVERRPAPVRVSGAGNASAVAAGNEHSLAVVTVDLGPTFADVPANYWAYDQIEAFAQRGITTGCGTDDQGRRVYCPERGVTRAEMAVFITRALGQRATPAPSTPTFADVPTDYWAYAAIEAFAQLGITTGCGTDDLGRRVFCPDRGVTRAEMAAFIDRAKGQTELSSATATFADVPADYWAYGWIERFYTLGVTTGCGTDDAGNKVYCPDRGVTRAEMAVFIIRAYP